MTRETTLGAYIAAATLLVAAQAAMIVALLASRARRRATEARNNAMLRALPDLMFVQTRDGVFLDYSAKDPSVLFAPPEFFLGKNMQAVLPPPLAALMEERVQRLFGGEEPVIVEYEVPDPSGDDDSHYYEARLVRLETDKFLSIVRDITDRKRATEALNRAQTELLRTSRLATLGEFAGSIAHELAQPLTAIIANSYACLRLIDRPGTDLSEVRDSLNDVLASGKIARDVINHTRHLFSHDDVEKSPLWVTDVINEVCVMVYSTLEAKSVTMDLRFAEGLPMVRGDRVQLRQVILNLISNGIQAMEHVDADLPRRLTIGTRLDGTGAATVTVSDTGVGLANVDRERLFSASYTTKTDGMGWGLSISRSIIEAHGGRLWAEPNRDGGAAFSFTLPAEAATMDDRFPMKREFPHFQS